MNFSRLTIVMTILFITVVMAIIVIIAGPVSGYTSFVIAGELCTGTLGIICHNA